MDVMQLRRGLMMGMASGAQFNSGTFVGSDNLNQTLHVGFEPDIVVVNCDLDFDTVGWVGTKNVVIVKNMITYQSRHNNTTTTNAYTAVTDDCGGDFPAYGRTDGYYTAYGTYSDGDFTVSNGVNNNLTRFINGATYNWIAVKYS